jgi:hypothetical protein
VSLIDIDNSPKANKANKTSKKNNKMSLFQTTFKKSDMSSQMNFHNSFIRNKSSKESNIRDFPLKETNMKPIPEDESVISHQKLKNENIGTFRTQEIYIQKNYLNEDDNNDNNNDTNSKNDSKKSSETYKNSKSKSKSFSSSSSSSESINFPGNLSKKILENKSKGSLSNISSNKEFEKSKNSYSIVSKINEEIYPDEEYNIPIREEMLLNKKIKLSKIENKSKINNFNNNKNKFGNSKVRILLDYTATLSNTNDFEKDKEKNEKQKRSDIKIDKKKVDFYPNLYENHNEKEEKKNFEVNKKITYQLEKKFQ